MRYVLLAVKNVLESSVNEDFIDFDYGSASLGGQG